MKCAGKGTSGLLGKPCIPPGSDVKPDGRPGSDLPPGAGTDVLGAVPGVELRLGKDFESVLGGTSGAAWRCDDEGRATGVSLGLVAAGRGFAEVAFPSFTSPSSTSVGGLLPTGAL